MNPDNLHSRSILCYIIVYSFLRNNDTVEGIMIQDQEMRDNFSRFPEVVLADSTYKINDRNMPMYVMTTVDGNGYTQPICIFLVYQETEETITAMVEMFKQANPTWTRIVVIITDKDMTERNVFKKCFPQVRL